MWLEEENVQKKSAYSVIHLKQILHDIKDNSHNTCVRFRLVGEMWQTHFVRVVNITGERMLVRDEHQDKLISVEINNIIQFEIDHRFKGIEPHNHYTVTPY